MNDMIKAVLFGAVVGVVAIVVTDGFPSAEFWIVTLAINTAHHLLMERE